MHIVYIFSFEGGGALPEDTSREGCGVGTPETRDAASRQLGRLGGDKKNQVLYKLSTLLAAPGTPLFGSAYANCYRLSTILWFSQNRFYATPRSQSLYSGEI